MIYLQSINDLFMRNKLMILALLMVCGCSTIKYVPIETDREVKVITETVYRDTVIFRDLPKESHSQMTVDTSRVETSLAESTVYIDTATNMINHSIRNKVDSIRVEYKYLERKVYRDSIITKEIPVEVEVEKTVIPK